LHSQAGPGLAIAKIDGAIDVIALPVVGVAEIVNVTVWLTERITGRRRNRDVGLRHAA
jgi:hypothetical protein